MKAEGGVEELRKRGTVRYEIHTPARGWYPSWARVISDTDSVILEVDSEDRDQELLHAALATGPVHSFTRRIPDLTELFQEVVQS